MRRSIARRLQRLERRFVPAVKQLDFTIRFVGPNGTAVRTLLLRGDQKIWDPPKDGACGPELAGKDAS